MRQQFRHQAWIVAAAAAVFFTHLGSTALWDEDETLYATCAREMFQAGDWVVPTFNGELFPEKPPLMYWLMISAYGLFGVTEFAARFWSAVLGIGTAVATYHIGRLLFRAEVGLWAGLITASTLIFTVSARAATVDSALVFLTTLAMLALVAGARSAQPAPGDDPSSRTGHPRQSRFSPGSWSSFLLMYAALGLAVLAKGPIGVLLPVAAIAIFLAIMNHLQQADGCRQRREAQPGERFPPLDRPNVLRVGRQMRVAASIIALWAVRLIGLVRPFGPRRMLRVAWQMRPLTAIAVVGAVAVPWYVLVGLRTEGVFLGEFFGVHNLGRALRPLQSHSGPWFYYVPAIMIGFFPWSVFLGPCLIQSARQLRQDHAWKTGTIFAACWLGVFVGLWSIPSTKLPHYVLTAYPALALLTATFVDAWISDPTLVGRWWLRNATVTLVVVGIGMMVALPVVSWVFVPGEWMLGLVGLILMVGGGLCLACVERGRPSQAMVTFAATSVIFVTAIFGFAALRIDRYQNAPVLLAEIRKDSPGPPQLAAYRFFRESLVFYAGKPVPRYDSADRLDEFLEDAEHPYVLTTDQYEEELRQRRPGELRVLIRRSRFLRSGEVVVLARRFDHHALRTAVRPAVRAKQ